MRSHQEQVLALQTELRCIENSISRLTQARFAVLREVNNVQPAMRNLPPEVLSTIFQIARPPIDFDVHYLTLENRDNAFHTQERFLYTLAAVSHYWRQVALSTPQLWTNVRLKFDDDPSPLSVKKNISLLNLHIQHSRNIPISIELDLKNLPSYESGYDSEGMLIDSEDDSEEEELISETIYQRERRVKVLEPLRTAVLVDQASTIQDLILIRPPIEWFKFVNETLSQCRSVTVFQPQLQILQHLVPNAIDLRNLPCLQRIQLINWPEPYVAIPSSIRTLHLRKLPPAGCIQLLLSCRNLVDFEAIDFMHWEGGDPRLKKSVVFPYLERFSWSNGSRWSDYKPGVGVLKRLRLPGLRSLVWSDDQDSPVSHPASQDLRGLFFSRLPTSLSSLTFIRMSTHSGNRTIERLLNCVPQVLELHLVDCPETTIRAAVKAIGRPFSATKIDSDASLAIVLPNLSKLSVISQAPVRRLDLPKIVDMLEALNEIWERKKRFQLVIKIGASWKEDGEVLQRLRALVKDGFDLEVVFGQRVLDLAPPRDL